jgi:hypothetical protein
MLALQSRNMVHSIEPELQFTPSLLALVATALHEAPVPRRHEHRPSRERGLAQPPPVVLSGHDGFPLARKPRPSVEALA